MFNEIIQNILVAFSMKMCRACCHLKMMIANSKNCKKISMCITFTIKPGLVELFYLSKPCSLSLTRNMNVKVAIELYYIFSKILKFNYWQLFSDTTYILETPKGLL